MLVTVRGQERLLGIGCNGSVPAVVLNLQRGSFDGSNVSVYWDNVGPVDYLFRRTGDSTLGLPVVAVVGILDQFRLHDTMLIGVERAPGEPVRELFSLRGAAAAAPSLPCGS